MEVRKWKMPGKGRARGTLDSEGFGGIAVDPSSRQTSGSAKPRVSRGNEVADKGRRSFLRRAEGQEGYSAKGTVCQCLFSV